MNVFKITQLIIFIFILIKIIPAHSQEVKIVAKLNNEIITNIDVNEEINYLIAINTNLKKFKADELNKIAKNLIINNKIKKNEILKYASSEDLTSKRDVSTNDALKDIYINLGLKDKNEFDLYLKNLNLDIENILNKIQIEILWNQLIFSKFNNQVKIDKEKIKNNILKNPKNSRKFELSEIIYEVKNKDEIEKKYNQIIKSIFEVGFEKTVILFSISSTNLTSGYLGWIDEKSISTKILREINNLNIGDLSKPIILSNGVLLIKLINKKIEKEEININDEVDKLYFDAFNSELNKLSEVYFSKLKNSYKINEF